MMMSNTKEMLKLLEGSSKSMGRARTQRTANWSKRQSYSCCDSWHGPRSRYHAHSTVDLVPYEHDTVAAAGTDVGTGDGQSTVEDPLGSGVQTS